MWNILRSSSTLAFFPMLSYSAMCYATYPMLSYHMLPYPMLSTSIMCYAILSFCSLVQVSVLFGAILFYIFFYHICLIQYYLVLSSFIHSFIPAISIAPLQVLYYSEALPTTAQILYRSFTPVRTGNCR